MALYDNYRQANSSYISQFAGSIVPEVSGFVNTMKNRYEEAQEQDDMLYEAMGNMIHLPSEADTLYANELKQEYATRMADRVQRGDYENMGRRTKRDARSFVTEYKPLANRLQAFQTIQQRVMDDENIFSPEKKQEILNYISTTNQTPKNPDGTFVRDANGKVALSAIKDWAYAKDVDIDKRLIEVLKEVEAESIQQGFVPDGQGLLVSQTNEVRSKEDLARMAYDRMKSDPEIAAMIKRDALLKTYNVQGDALNFEVATRNRSKYDDLVASGLKPEDIEKLAVNSGMTVEELKVKPYDMIEQAYTSRGMSAEQAKRDFLRVRVEDELKQPHIDLVSDILKVDKTKLDARQDASFAARLKFEYDKKLKDYEAEMEKAEIIQQFVDDPEAKTLDFIELQKNYKEANDAYVEANNVYKSQLGTLIGDKPTIVASVSGISEEVKEWDNRMSLYLNNSEKQIELLNNIKDPNTKNELQALFSRHAQSKVKLQNASQSMEAIPQSVFDSALDKAWKLYSGNTKDPNSREYKTKQQYGEYLKKKMETADIGNGFLGIGWQDKNAKGLISIDRSLNAYIRELNEGVKANRGRTQPAVSVFEPYGSGYVRDMTQMFTNLAAGSPNTFVDRSGNSFTSFIDKFAGENKWKERDKRTYLNNLRVRMTDQLSPSGQAQFVISLPDGSTRVFENNSFSTTKAKEMATRMMEGTAHNFTETERSYQAANVARSFGTQEIIYTDDILLNNARIGQIVDLNDKYAFKINTSSKGSLHGAPTAGDLMVKDPRTGNYTEVMPETNNITLEQLRTTLGMESFNNIYNRQ